MKSVELLNQKIDELIKMYQEVKKENESLRNQLVASQGQNESLHSKTRHLENDIAEHDIEIDTMLEKLRNLDDDETTSPTN